MKKNSNIILIFFSPIMDRICSTQKIIVFFIAAWVVAMAALMIQCGPGFSMSSDAISSATIYMAETSAQDGGMLLDTRCSVCHGSNKAKQSKKTREQWDQTVTRMISKGAKLTEDERAVLLDYLAENFGYGSNQ